jgi:hypothetical protein
MGQPSKEVKQRWLAANKHKRPKINRDCRLRTFYGLPPEEEMAMYIKQGNRCAICNVSFDFSNPNGPKSPHLDHEHDSGWVRGILCVTCNHGIGQFYENINTMQLAIEYLIANACPTEFNIGAARAALKKKTSGNKKPRTAEELQRLKQAGFQSGLIPWNKGKSWDEETRAKMGKAQKTRWEDATEAEREVMMDALNRGRETQSLQREVG